MRFFIIKPNDSIGRVEQTLTVQCPDLGDKQFNYHSMEEISFGDILFICIESDIRYIAVARSDCYRIDDNFSVPSKLDAGGFYRTVDVALVKKLEPLVNADSLDGIFYERTTIHKKRKGDGSRIYNTFKSQFFCTELKYYYYGKLSEFVDMPNLVK